ncbi:hypothetical protein A6395_06705 [Exiguobacterium sp. SH31]|uniref:hypothetical protein n=1 Tax=Exiguobacterium sp. SH31 TaxID=1843183 RepID=UPI0008D3D76A|nr:hypothetical protein [Exiguobacterium sp. SH31]OGX79450.1 hypothetical protein A6395_06705 [Exiguobacterium sp. SH31]
MFKRKLIWPLVAFIAIVVLLQNGRTFYENRKLDRYLTEYDFHAYTYDQIDESTLALFTNEDETLLGLAEMNDDDYAFETVDSIDMPPFDYVHLHDETTHYFGVRLNHNPQKVASLRIIGELMQEQHVLNRPEEDAFSEYHILKLHNAPQENWTLQTLDQNNQVLDSIDL